MAYCHHYADQAHEENLHSHGITNSLESTIAALEIQFEKHEKKHDAMVEAQVAWSKIIVWKYRYAVKHFFEDLNQMGKITPECIMNLAQKHELMCIFAKTAEYHRHALYGTICRMKGKFILPLRIITEILTFTIDISDNKHNPCFYISEVNGTVFNEIGFTPNHLVGLLCRANQLKVGCPGRFEPFYEIRDYEEAAAFDINKKHFFNINCEFLKAEKFVFADGNNLNISHYPLNCTDEESENGLNSVVFPLFNFDARSQCFINLNQFFIFHDKKSTLTNSQSFSLAKRLDMVPDIDFEEALDVLEDVYVPHPIPAGLTSDEYAMQCLQDLQESVAQLYNSN